MVVGRSRLPSLVLKGARSFPSEAACPRSQPVGAGRRSGTIGAPAMAHRAANPVAPGSTNNSDAARDSIVVARVSSAVPASCTERPANGAASKESAAKPRRHGEADRRKRPSGRDASRIRRSGRTPSAADRGSGRGRARFDAPARPSRPCDANQIVELRRFFTAIIDVLSVSRSSARRRV